MRRRVLTSLPTDTRFTVGQEVFTTLGYTLWLGRHVAQTVLPSPIRSLLNVGKRKSHFAHKPLKPKVIQGVERLPSITRFTVGS